MFFILLSLLILCNNSMAMNDAIGIDESMLYSTEKKKTEIRFKEKERGIVMRGKNFSIILSNSNCFNENDFSIQ